MFASRVIFALSLLCAAWFPSSVVAQATAVPTTADRFDLSGSWYEPATSGQGLLVEVLTSEARSGTPLLFAGWFTYTGTRGGVAQQEWYTLQGDMTPGTRSYAVGIFRSAVGRFDSTPTTSATNVGSATLTFNSCTSATLTYTFTAANGSRSGRIDLVRLADNVSCGAGATVAKAPRSFLNTGAFFKPETSGQGFFLEYNPTTRLLFGAWYTYTRAGAATPGRRWYTLQKNNVDVGTGSVEDVGIFETTGGVFDTPGAVATRQVGVAQVRAYNCRQSEITYRFTSGELSGVSGRQFLQRVVSDPAQCADDLVTTWRERILNADGSINAAEYRNVAANYNRADIVDYRLGPKSSDYAIDRGTTPNLWGPDLTSGQGLWPSRSLPATNPGEPEKCLPPSLQPTSDGDEAARGLRGAGWLVGGQHIFLPDAPNDSNFRFGISNTRGADGAVFDTGGLCMRMIASWNGDWWNRNNIATPANPDVRALAGIRPDLPLVPVAIARGRANSSQVSFAAFRDGTIAPIRVGNTAAEFFDASAIRLPPGMVPTSLAVTPYNEFLVVTVWDTNTITGKLAFIALRPRQMAVGNPSQSLHTRWYWGTPGAWTNRGMKLLGFVDLPFAAPSSIDVSNHLALQNPRGFGDNDSPARGDFAQQSARDLWRNVDPISPGSQQWHQMATAGYAVVASRAEGRVSFVDMGPLYRYFREMYLTTQANFNRTVDASATDPAKWPFAFSIEARQRPVVATTLEVRMPTSVSAGVQASGAFSDRSTDIFERLVRRSPKEDWSGAEPERYLGRSRAFVASMDGEVKGFNVQGLNLPRSPVGLRVPAEPVVRFMSGRNPRFAYVNPTSTAVEDLHVVSRVDRTVTFVWPTGEMQGVLRDQRLRDPVGAAVSVNYAGYGGLGPGRAVVATFVSVLDFEGRAIFTYPVDPQRGPLPELYPFVTPQGPTLFLFGSKAPFPGKPFMIDMEEII
jgi:hypothetical protein